MNKRFLIVMFGGLVFLNSCSENTPEQIKGFGNLRKLSTEDSKNNLGEIPADNIYETEDNSYVIESKGNYYLIDKEGRLITLKCKYIEKRMHKGVETIFVHNWDHEYKNLIPLTKFDARGDLFVQKNFTERNNRLYLKSRPEGLPQNY